MEGTRTRILYLLQKKGCYTVEGLSRSLGLAPATVRRHLDILQRDQFVTFAEVRKKTGRPEYSFFLTETGQERLPKGYHRLLSMLVREIENLGLEDTKGMAGQEMLGLLFSRLSKQIVAKYWERLERCKFNERLSTLVEILQAEEFLPETEEINGSVRIRLLNCPFRYAAMESGAVCEFDASLISTVLDVPISSEGCIQNGDAGCVYVARPAPQEPGASVS